MMTAVFKVTTLRQSNNPASGKAPRHQDQKKAGQVKSNVKSMISTFFDVKGIVHKEFVPTAQNVNSGFYCDVLRLLRENVRRRRSKLWRERAWLLQHDNAPSPLPSSPTSFWPKTKRLSSPIHHTPLIWHPVTSSYFKK